MQVPGKLLYTEEHEWISIEGDVATVGISEYAQGELGDVVFIELPKVGTTVKQMESFGTIEAVKAVSDLFAPVSGEIVEVNSVLNDAPETVNKSPYKEGWMLRIRMSDPEEAKQLMDADTYKEKIS
ncbi:MAG: glycine cleavage system protein GcvH [Calditrichaeota bacterium]|nr:glycine cleavage system protein GcvH [Calditrichota bacterium]